MIPSNRLPQNPTEYQSVPDDPADWVSMMQQWINIKDVPKNNRNPNSLTCQQIVKPVKSEIVESSTSAQILNPIKSEVVELPTSQILKPVNTKIVDFPTYLELLKPIMSEVIEATELSDVDFGEASVNLVAEVHSSPLKEVNGPSKIRQSLKNEKLKKEKMKPERSTELKPEMVPEDIHRDNVGDSTPNNFGPVSKSLKHSRFSPATVQHPRLNPPSNCLSQKTSNDPVPTCEMKDKIMEESLQKVKRILLQFLMETTENQVKTIAKEELRRAKSKAQSVREKFSVLSSLSGKLGLNVYDSDGSDTSEKQADERNELESDEELQTLVYRRQRDFEKTEMRINLEIESLEKKERFAYPDSTNKECVTRNDCETNKVDANGPLTLSHCEIRSINSKITEVVSESQNLAIGFYNSEKQQHQPNRRQKNGTQFSIKENGVIQNRKSIESPPENVSSSSTLSASSLSSTSSSDSSADSSSDSSGSDDHSNRGSRTRRRSKIRKTFKSSPDRRSPKRKSSSRHSAPYRGESRFRSRRLPSRSRRSPSRSRSERKSSRHRRGHPHRRDSDESRRSSYQRIRR